MNVNYCLLTPISLFKKSVLLGIIVLLKMLTIHRVSYPPSEIYVELSERK